MIIDFGKKADPHIKEWVAEQKQGILQSVQDPQQKAALQAIPDEEWVKKHFFGMLTQRHAEKESRKFAMDLEKKEKETKESKSVKDSTSDFARSLG